MLKIIGYEMYFHKMIRTQTNFIYNNLILLFCSVLPFKCVIEVSLSTKVDKTMNCCI